MYTITFVRDRHQRGTTEVEIAGLMFVQGVSVSVHDFIARQIKNHPQTGRDFVFKIKREKNPTRRKSSRRQK